MSVPNVTGTSYAMARILTPDGTYEREADLPDLSPEQMLAMYEWMLLMRTFDNRCVTLQRQGRIGTYPPLQGQEAAQVGSAFALEKDDWIFPSYRDQAALAVHGLPLDQSLLYWMGREEGSAYPPGVNIFPNCIPIATQIPHGVGAAWAAKLRQDPIVTIVYFGDGATSEGDFHEGANFAAIYRAPCVLFCQNNHYAISLPVDRQTSTDTIAQKAAAYGMPGVRVDGNDVLAVYQVTKEAVQRARSGEGPTLIEAVTYRLGAHTTVDDPSRYRSEDEVAAWAENDPILRFRRFLERQGHWNPDLEEKLQEKARRQVAEAIQKAEAAPPPRPEDIFDYVYSELPPHLAEQKNNLLASLKEAE